MYRRLSIFYEVEKIKTITICGSMKFAENMKQIAWKEPITDEAQKRLAAAHYRKIDMCDAVYIVDIDGYIGKAVANEILYAKEKGKELIFHSRQS